MIPGFDVTLQLPQNTMLILFEGAVQYELRHVLLRLKSNRILSIEQLNESIFSYMYGNCQSSQIRETAIDTDTYKLKLNAAQARLFLRKIPFILVPLVGENHQLLEFILEL